jgi:hypothetical protein
MKDINKIINNYLDIPFGFYRKKNNIKSQNIQKASGDIRPGHKYVKRVPKANGKGFSYFYTQAEYNQFKADQQEGWLSKIAGFFNFKDKNQAMKQVMKDYESHEIGKKYNLTWDSWKSHVSAYFMNKEKWDKFFSGKKEQKTTPEKKEKKEEKPAEKKEKKESMTGLKLQVMREIFNIYGKKETPAIEILEESSILPDISKERAKELTGQDNPSSYEIKQNFYKMDSSEQSLLIENLKRNIKDTEKTIKGYREKRGEVPFDTKSVYTDYINKWTQVLNGQNEQLKRFEKEKIIEKIETPAEPVIESAPAQPAEEEEETAEMSTEETPEQKKKDIKIAEAINKATPETRNEVEREILDIPEIKQEDVIMPVSKFNPTDTEVEIPFSGKDKQPVKYIAKDYTAVRPKDIYLAKEKTILTDPRPAYIPEVDEAYFRSSNYFIPAYKLGEDKYLLALNAKRMAPSIRDWGKEIGENNFAIVNRDVFAATQDYYLKKAKAKLKEDQALRTRKKRITMLPENKISYHQMDLINSFTGGSRYETKNLWEIYRWLRQDLKQKTEDMEIQLEDYYSTYTKGKETAYGDKGTKDNLLQDYGVKVKRQNGAEINELEIQEIKSAMDDLFSVFGNKSSMAKTFGLKISHAGDKMMHARKAIGLFIPSMHAIGVTAHGDKGTGFIISHEWGHFMDYYIGEKTGRHYASDNPEDIAGEIASTFRKNMVKKQTSKYQNRTCECFARAMEQYWAIKTKNNDIMDVKSPNHPTEEIFVEKIMPSIDKFLQNNDALLKGFYRYKNQIFKIKK